MNTRIRFLILAAASAWAVFAQDPPYPASAYTLACDESSRQQSGLGSDLWQLTLGPDGRLYAVWGEGWGWNRQRNDQKRGFGVTRITSRPGSLKAEDLWDYGPGWGVYRPLSLIFANDALYLFWKKGAGRYREDATHLAFSADLGRTWDTGEYRRFTGIPAGLMVSGVVQGESSEYVYVYFARSQGSDFYLARVPRGEIESFASYRWFAGGDRWTESFDGTKPVFHDPNGYLWHIGVSYIAPLGRYLLTKPHYTPHDNPAATQAPESGLSSLGVFEAPTPWGPWTTVHYEDDFLDDKAKFSYFIPTPWVSADGREFWLTYSGRPEYASFNLIRCRLGDGE
ncbi:MAG: DUF4185 domain-containing protein [Acidobacteria bacterium]|nr:DUF4185 domain-containing protein [Acidobacteriota bacterium]MDA1235045.1 DUF4185 domain-containing protein [Acidobacteriota bacterium]